MPFLLAIKKNRRVIILRQLPNLFSRQSVLCCPRIESSAGEGRVSAQRDMKTEPRARLLARRNPESGVEQPGTCGTCGLIRIGILMFGDILISIIKKKTAYEVHAFLGHFSPKHFVWFKSWYSLVAIPNHRTRGMHNHKPCPNCGLLLGVMRKTRQYSIPNEVYKEEHAHM